MMAGAFGGVGLLIGKGMTTITESLLIDVAVVAVQLYSKKGIRIEKDRKKRKRFNI